MVAATTSKMAANVSTGPNTDESARARWRPAGRCTGLGWMTLRRAVRVGEDNPMLAAGVMKKRTCPHRT